jgi:spermidine synthase
MKPFKEFLLLGTVFITGASSLIVEVVGLRVLSPYYGNTIFTVSSVVSVILFALSCGYYLGGKLADRRASLRSFFGLIFVSGIVLLLFYSLGAILLPVLGAKLSIVLGPLVSAMLLFFPGAMLLGTLSPYAVKLQSIHLGKESVGSATGGIFFWSTLGSIGGSLSAGFVLIPRFGIDRILIANGLVLSLLGLAPLLFLGDARKKIVLPIVALICALGTTAGAARYSRRDALYVKDGVYQKISIYDGEYNGRPTRFFQQDQNSAGAGEGAMFLDSDEPTDLVYDYTRYYALYKIFTPQVQNALVIGGGAYSVPKALLREIPQASVDVVDIEPSLFSLGQRFFKLTESPRLHNHVEDGRRFLRDSQTKYDLIFSDVYYSFFSVPPHFATKEFFTIAREKLAPNGIFIANMIGDLSRQPQSLVMAVIKTFQLVFPNTYVFAVSWPDKTDSQNIMLVAYNSDQHIDLNSRSILASSDPLLRSLPSRLVDVNRRFDLSPYPVLTDNYSPVEYLTAQVLERAFGTTKAIDGEEMLADVAQQQRYGARVAGAPGHQKEKEFLSAEMNLLAQDVEFQNWKPAAENGESTNIVAHFFASAKRRVLLATRYDSRGRSSAADAAGVAVLAELARAFGDLNVPPSVGIDMVFLDGSDAAPSSSPGSGDAQPSAGSIYFAQHLRDLYGDEKPVAAIVLDGVCRPGAIIRKDHYSVAHAAEQVEAVWSAARRASRDMFPDATAPQVNGDQMPLIEVGIPSVLLAEESKGQTADAECSARTLEDVGLALLNYLAPPDRLAEK